TDTSWTVIRSASCVGQRARGRATRGRKCSAALKLELSETTNPARPERVLYSERTRGEPAPCNVPELTALKRNLGQIVIQIGNVINAMRRGLLVCARRVVSESQGWPSCSYSRAICRKDLF